MLIVCPQCQVEYRAGFAECSDCHVPLVTVADPEPESDQNRNRQIGLLGIAGILLLAAIAKVLLPSVSTTLVVIAGIIADAVLYVMWQKLRRKKS